MMDLNYRLQDTYVTIKYIKHNKTYIKLSDVEHFPPSIIKPVLHSIFFYCKNL